MPHVTIRTNNTSVQYVTGFIINTTNSLYLGKELSFITNVLQHLKVLMFNLLVRMHLNLKYCAVYKTTRHGKETDPCYGFIFMGQ